MSFNYNEALSEDQIRLKEELVRQIHTDAQKDRKSSISSIPVHASLEQFIDAVANLIDFDQRNAAKKIILKDEDTGGNVMEHPKYANEDLSGVVLYSLVRRAPGTTEGGNEPFSRQRRETRPKIREIVTNDPLNPGRATVIKSQWFDNLLRFKIVARSSTQANKLALWFEKLMENNRYYFAALGITRFFFDEREEDKFSQIGNEPYYMRPLLYYVRTEETFETDEQALNNIVVCLTSLNKENQNGTR